MKKIILAILLLSASLMGCVSEQRHTYLPEDRPEMFINQNASRLYNPGVETNIGLADLIAQVEITSGQVVEEVTTQEGVPWSFCYYDAHVENVWYGEPVDTDIRIYLHGTDAILHKYDQVVVYLSYDEQTYYVPVDGEYSVFILNPPDDGVFPFAMVSEYEALEGEDVSVLRAETDDAFQRILNREADIWPSGDVFEPYKTEETASE